MGIPCEDIKAGDQHAPNGTTLWTAAGDAWTQPANYWNGDLVNPAITAVPIVLSDGTPDGRRWAPGSTVEHMVRDGQPLG